MITNYKQATENIRTQLRTYLINSGLKSLVCGISGGIDSALCVALARPVCDELGVKLIGRSITIQTNKADEIERAKNIGEAFLHDFKEADLSDAFTSLVPMIAEGIENEDSNDKAYKIRLGNVKARTRMIYLYHIASLNGGMVLSTDNYTELLLGFWTLHGDVGDYGMIQNLWKTEVYGLSKYLASNMTNKLQANSLLACVDAVPTDGLGITNSDLEQIGASSYEEVDTILIDILRNGKDSQYKNHKVAQRNRNSNFKRENPFNVPRIEITETPLI